ncbi:MAG: endolytic transglycosylase MltG [Anaerolineae bacterium]|nr:endolytic transglycosylase MltG [Anaerolineae bacterium]
MNAVRAGAIRILLRLVTLVVGISAVCLVLGGAGIYLWSSAAKDAAPVTISLTADKLEKAFWDVYLLPKRDLVMTPVAPGDDRSEQFVIERGETLWSVSLRLENAGLISDATVFRRVLQAEGLDREIEAGAYTLRRNMTMGEIMREFQVGRVPDVIVTIPEGWRAEQVARRLSEKGVIRSEQEFLDAVASMDIRYMAMQGMPEPAPAGLEGYLYPETYRFDTGSSPEDVVARMVSLVAAKVTDEMADKAVKRGLTMYQVVTLASIVEREAVLDEERPLIASVYLNRLQEGMLLQADPTVQYAKGCVEGGDGELKCWEPMAQEEAITVESPYNTFLNSGLPPGPICSPRIASIQAVLEPADTDYLFFYSKRDGSGQHVFARTYEEHLRNEQIYSGVAPTED